MSRYVEVTSLGEKYQVNLEDVSLIQATDGGKSCTIYVIGYPNPLMLDASYEEAIQLIVR